MELCHCPEQVTHVARVGCTALNGDQYPVRVCLRINRDTNHAVYTAVSDLLFIWLTIDLHDTPAFELKRRSLEQRLCSRQITGYANNLIKFDDLSRKMCVASARRSGQLQGW